MVALGAVPHWYEPLILMLSTAYMPCSTGNKRYYPSM
ncbi:unnamed protein product, partial [marine sediment metagenome]